MNIVALMAKEAADLAVYGEGLVKFSYDSGVDPAVVVKVASFIGCDAIELVKAAYVVPDAFYGLLEKLGMQPYDRNAGFEDLRERIGDAGVKPAIGGAKLPRTQRAIKDPGDNLQTFVDRHKELLTPGSNPATAIAEGANRRAGLTDPSKALKLQLANQEAGGSGTSASIVRQLTKNQAKPTGTPGMAANKANWDAINDEVSRLAAANAAIPKPASPIAGEMAAKLSQKPIKPQAVLDMAKTDPAQVRARIADATVPSEGRAIQSRINRRFGLDGRLNDDAVNLRNQYRGIESAQRAANEARVATNVARAGRSSMDRLRAAPLRELQRQGRVAFKRYPGRTAGVLGATAVGSAGLAALASKLRGGGEGGAGEIAALSTPASEAVTGGGDSGGLLGAAGRHPYATAALLGAGGLGAYGLHRMRSRKKEEEEAPRGRRRKAASDDGYTRYIRRQEFLKEARDTVRHNSIVILGRCLEKAAAANPDQSRSLRTVHASLLNGRNLPNAMKAGFPKMSNDQRYELSCVLTKVAWDDFVKEAAGACCKQGKSEFPKTDGNTRYVTREEYEGPGRSDREAALGRSHGRMKASYDYQKEASIGSAIMGGIRRGSDLLGKGVSRIGGAAANYGTQAIDRGADMLMAGNRFGGKALMKGGDMLQRGAQAFANGGAASKAALGAGVLGAGALGAGAIGHGISNVAGNIADGNYGRAMTGGMMPRAPQQQPSQQPQMPPQQPQMPPQQPQQAPMR